MDETITTLSFKTTCILRLLTCATATGFGFSTLAPGKDGGVVESLRIRYAGKMPGQAGSTPTASSNRKVGVLCTTIHNIGVGPRVCINLASFNSNLPSASTVYASKNISNTDKEAACLQAQCVSSNASIKMVSDRNQGTIFLYFLAIWLPFLPVAMLRGCSADLLINILLDILGWIPGVIHAWYIISKAEKEPVRRKDPRY
jgi:uncharacterized membrane protein YqaE (UPF0057 family)